MDTWYYHIIFVGHIAEIKNIPKGVSDYTLICLCNRLCILWLYFEGN
jgi:hypothetical protein